MVAEHRERFLAAMDDDLDTPAALPELHALAAICLSGRSGGCVPRRVDGARARRAHPGPSVGDRAQRGGDQPSEAAAPHDPADGPPEPAAAVEADAATTSFRSAFGSAPWFRRRTRGLDAAADLGRGRGHAGGAAGRADLVLALRHRPASADATSPGPTLLAIALALGRGDRTTQMGGLRPDRHVAAGLFGALVVVMLGVVMAGQRQVGVASPTLAHAFAAAVAGLAGVVTAALLASAASRIRGRFARLLPPLIAGVAVAVIAVGAVLPA